MFIWGWLLVLCWFYALSLVTLLICLVAWYEKRPFWEGAFAVFGERRCQPGMVTAG